MVKLILYAVHGMISCLNVTFFFL